MSKPAKSRHGLTRCTACRTHIRAEERPSLTTCPFCGANLHRSTRGFSLPTGRGGVLAASLFALSAAGCGGDGAEEPATVEPADDTAGDDTSSNDGPSNDDPADDQYADDPVDDNTAVAEYGIAPPADEPMYGMPPG